MKSSEIAVRLAAVVLVVGGMTMGNSAVAERFEGRYFMGEGDVGYVELLNTAYRLFYPDPEFQNISMLYNPTWNGFVEGPTWGAWWIQNSYGPSYCALPFFLEPYTTFLQNAQALWFNLMGDGKRAGDKGYVAPDGCLCDAAAPNLIYYKQGDGRVDIHDWGMEFTAAGIVMQSELLLISRDREAISRYLPKLERSANFIETRRDPKNNLFLAGPAGNLLAPSYAGCKKPDGTYDKAYLTGLSVTYIAALDRLIELEKMAGNAEKAALYTERRDLAKKGLPLLMTDEGYFVKYMDPDGTKHGVYGAANHGYFEAICNHDAIAFRVVDDDQARKIYNKIVSIPDLRRHDVIITNCPGLDDMYEPPTSWLWQFGTWVNGGHWTTCEARMMLGYYRLGAYDDARRSMQHIMKFARQFRMDNNLVEFGDKPYQPKEPINCVYDTWGAPAALIRGLFEYLYRADGLTLMPHIPPGISLLEQRFPIRFGKKLLYIATKGNGPIANVTVEAQPWKQFDEKSVFLPYESTPDSARIVILMGGAKPPEHLLGIPPCVPFPPNTDKSWDISTATTMAAANTLPLHIGADSNGNNKFMGRIRRARVFSRSLKPEEIAALAKSPSANLDGDPALVADYVLDKMADNSFANGVPGMPNAKAVGNVKVVGAPGGGAAEFTGDGYLEAAHDPKLALKEAFTLDAWICPDKQPDTGGRIIDKVTAGVDNGYLLDTCPGNSLRLITELGSVSYDAKFEPGKWVHVAGTFDAKDELRLYINGAKAVSAPAKKAAPPVKIERFGQFYNQMAEAGLADSYEAQHAKLAADYVRAIHTRKNLLDTGKLQPLPETSQIAADKSYVVTMMKLGAGLQRVMESYEKSDDPHKSKVYKIWQECFE